MCFDVNFTRCSIVLFMFPSEACGTIHAFIDGNIHICEIALR